MPLPVIVVARAAVSEASVHCPKLVIGEWRRVSPLPIWEIDLQLKRTVTLRVGAKALEHLVFMTLFIGGAGNVKHTMRTAANAEERIIVGHFYPIRHRLVRELHGEDVDPYDGAWRP